MSGHRVLTSLILVALCLSLAAQLSYSQGSSGAFNTSIPITVPSFRGLEPSLSLSYSSSGGNGTLGAGWALIGFSTIERTDADGGAPQYDSTDSYRIGGQKLRVCGASSSPGCLANGTHFTEHENYQRMTFDSGLDTWTVDAKNGSTRTYTPVFTLSGQTFRWGLTSVTDILGNTVAYNWWCDGTKNCYPDDVSYNGYRVKFFYRNDRTDGRTFATGVSIGETTQLLRSIKVELQGGTAIRAYDLQYISGGSSSTGRSLLESVQTYGTDVVIDDLTGVISGGQSLPEESFSYLTDSNDHELTDGSAWGNTCTWYWGSGDFNGDGRQDYYCHHELTGELNIGISNGTSFTVTNWATFCGAINDWMQTGDYNGDGKTDFLCKGSTGLFVALSDGTSLTTTSWLFGWCTNNQLISGDFNSDGMTDITCFGSPNGSFETRVSDGSSFSSASVGGIFGGWCKTGIGMTYGINWGGNSKEVYLGDYDGDGHTDLLCETAGPLGPWLAKGDGTGNFIHDGAEWSDPGSDCSGTGDQQGTGDFNGDGKTDFYCYDKGFGDWDTWVGLSDGSDFHFTEWLGTRECDKFSVSDMNGDGNTDTWCHTSTKENHVALSNGMTGFTDLSMWKSNWCSNTYLMSGDFNGDSKSDLYCRDTSEVAISGGVAGKTDLLTSITNSFGGVTTVTYVPGTIWSQSSAPPPAVLTSGDLSGSTTTSPSTHRRSSGSPTVTSITVNDGRGWTKTTTYEYADAVYDAGERRWLGYGYSKSTEPPLGSETYGPYTETWYKQEIAATGAVDKSESRDGDGNLLAAMDNLFSTGGDGDTVPWFAKIDTRYAYEYDGSGNACGAWPCTYGQRRAQDIDYDAYGNQVEVRSFGNVDANDDEVTTVSEYYPDTSLYITNKLARSITFYGIGTSGVKLTDVLVFYDDALSYNLSPTQGLVTNRSVWLDTENRYIPQCTSGICVEYDTYGNVTKTTDIKGGQTIIAYDSSYDLFPETMTNPLGHTVTGFWDPGCGVPISGTDPNQQTTTTTYDEFCRHERTDGSLGLYYETFYISAGDPTAQYTEVQTPSPTGTGVHWTRFYSDGLGRTYKNLSLGATGTNIASGEQVFNERGGVAGVANPRFETDTAYMTFFGYDVRNRRNVTLHPDSATEFAIYGLNFTLNYNPESDLIATSRDATGLITWFSEYLGSTPIVTTTIQDIDARRQVIIDAAGNAWVTDTDSLGRIIYQDDPDAGITTSEYNDAGELTAVVNGANERTEFTYDLLGRTLTKTTLAGTLNADVTTFVYDEDDDDGRPGYFNIGALTSVHDAAGFRETDYDEFGRPERVERSVDQTGYEFTHNYNVAGLPASTTYPDMQVISWTYDATGGLQTETGTITSSVYDAAGRPTSRTFANGTATTYDYSATRGWLEGIETLKGSTTIQDLDYLRYSDGMVQTVTSAKQDESWSYLYDDLNRLTVATNVDNSNLTKTFTYNDIGNVTYNSSIGMYSYPAAGADRPHAVTGAEGRTYQYDAAGRMTNRNGTIINWNGDGKPSSIGNIGFTYGGTGERLKKDSGGQATTYIGGDYEIADNGTVTKYLLGGKQVGSSFFVHHQDHLGSIQAVTDNFGAEVRRQAHMPFGDQHSAIGSHLESKGWIGEREEETELVYLNARYYDPEIGRFTAPDPLAGLGQALNRYSYSWNNPINFLDPSGLNPEDDDPNFGFKICTGGDPNPNGSGGCSAFAFWGLSDFFGWLGGLFSGGADYVRPDHIPPDYEVNSMDGEEQDSETDDGIQGPTSEDAGPGVAPVYNEPNTPDNPLYNCLNGGKWNCAGNRRFGGLSVSFEFAEGIVRSETLATNSIARSVSYGGYDVYLNLGSHHILLDHNVLGEEAFSGGDGRWSAPVLAALPNPGKIGRVLGRRGRQLLKQVWAEELPRTTFSLRTRRRLAQVFAAVARRHKPGSAARQFNIARAKFIRGRGPSPGTNINEFSKRTGYPILRNKVPKK